MSRKVELKYIVNDAKRRASLKKRKGSLIKKVDEISVLAGIEACAIIYTPNDPQPEVWPSPSEAKRVISKFRELPEHKQNNKMMTQESFLRERIQKAKEKLEKLRYENRMKEMTHLMNQCLSAGGVSDTLSLIDLNDLSWVIDQNLSEINQKINERSQCQEGTASGAAAINEEQTQVEATQK